MRNGSRSPFSPYVEVSFGCPPFSSVHDRALLPLLAAKKMFSPATEFPVK